MKRFTDLPLLFFCYKRTTWILFCSNHQWYYALKYRCIGFSYLTYWLLPPLICGSVHLNPSEFMKCNTKETVQKTNKKLPPHSHKFA